MIPDRRGEESAGPASEYVPKAQTREQGDQRQKGQDQPRPPAAPFFPATLSFPVGGGPRSIIRLVVVIPWLAAKR